MGRNVRKIITRKKIMDAATSQFAEKGFDAASIDSIVDEAKVAHGTVFWHFGNKEQLYVEVARWAGNQFYEAMHAFVERDGMPPSITELANMQYEYLKKNPHIGRLSLSIVFEAIGPHPELAQAMRLFNRRVTDIWRQWALRCSEVGLLKPGFEPEVVGTMIATTLAGINISSHIHNWESAAHHFETVARVFSTGCLMDQPTSELVAPEPPDKASTQQFAREPAISSRRRGGRTGAR